MKLLLKRSLCMVLALVMILGAMPVLAYAETQEGDLTQTMQSVEDQAADAAAAEEAPAAPAEEEAETSDSSEPEEEQEESAASEPEEEQEASTPSEPGEEQEESAASEPEEQEASTPSEPGEEQEESAASEPEEEQEASAPSEPEEEADVPVTSEPEEDPSAQEELLGTQEDSAEQSLQEEVRWGVYAGQDLGYTAEEAYEYYAMAMLEGIAYTPFGIWAREGLNETQQALYDGMKSIFQAIAAGTRASSIITAAPSGADITLDIYDMPEEELIAVWEALQMDMPYECYWFFGGGLYTFSSANRQVTMYLSIAAPFHNGQPTQIGEKYSYYVTADTSKTGAVASAVANVNSIVAQYAGKSDFKKIQGYTQWICEQVSYDFDAVKNNSFAEDANPWTLIGIFDNNTETKTVCQGYARAMQYLCDRSTFQSAKCHYIIGTAGGDHAWNIIEIGGSRYLLDVTNYDANYGSYRPAFFMAGAPRNSDGSYTIGGVDFFHKESYCKLLFGSENVDLASDYYQDTEPQEATAVTIRYGDEEVNGQTLELYTGKTMTLEAVVSPTAASQSVAWQSSDPETATVDSDGLVTPVKTGTVTITAAATDGSDKKAEVAITVLQSITSLALDQTELTIYGGESHTFVPAIAPDDAANKTLAWKITGDTAGVSIRDGVLTTEAVTDVQSVTVSAKAQDGSGLEAACTVTILPAGQSVTIKKGSTTVSQTTLRLYHDQTLKLTAQVSPAAASQSVAWQSSDPEIATVDSDGLVTPVKAGTVTITAETTDGFRKQAEVTITVVERMTGLTLDVTELTLLGGQKYTFTPSFASGNDEEISLGWKISGQTSGVRISDSGVLSTRTVRSRQEVTVCAYAQDDSGLEAECDVTIVPKGKSVAIRQGSTTVTKKSLVIYDYQPMTLTAAVSPADATQAVAWRSSDETIATVSADGVVTPVTAGTVTITAAATDGTGKNAYVKVTVFQEVTGLTLNASELVVGGGKKATFVPSISPGNATNKELTWKVSGQTSGVKISSSGVLSTKSVKGRQEVTVTAMASDGSGVTATCDVTILPQVSSVVMTRNGVNVTRKSLTTYRGETLDLAAEVSPADACQEVVWQSSNEAVVTVSSGVVTPVGAGKATVTATATDGSKKSARVTITVGQKMTGLTMAETEMFLCEGAKYTFKPTITPGNTTNKALTWTLSGETAGISISRKGVLTVKTVNKRQTVTVSATAQDGSGLAASCTVTVTPKAKSVTIRQGEAAVTGKTLTLAADQTLNLMAVVNPEDVSQNVAWKVSGSAARVSADGEVTPVKAGTVTITATTTDGSKKSAKVRVKVLPQLMKSLEIPKTLTLTGGMRYTFTPAISPSNTANKRLRWKVTGQTTGVRISSSGVLTTRAVKRVQTVTVSAYARDDSGLAAACTVTIHPNG